MRVLVSVSDTGGLLGLVEALVEVGAQLVATTSTRAYVREVAGVRVGSVEEITGFPPVLGGRVKTLHPYVHGGILARRDDAEDRAIVEGWGVGMVDMVVVGLYPFGEAAARGDDEATCVEQIDIGGVALLRAAAKNWRWVTAVSSPDDYGEVIAALREGGAGGVDEVLRRELARRTFARVSAYDGEIARWFGGVEEKVITGERLKTMRYGENPHQKSWLYGVGVGAGVGAGKGGVVGARQVQGKELGFNNLTDAWVAWRAVGEFGAGGTGGEVGAVGGVGEVGAVVVKHGTPCGVAVRAKGEEAVREARAADAESAFGGVVAVGGGINEAVATALAESFLEVVVAPTADEAALAVLAQKKQLRVLLTGEAPINKGGEEVVWLGSGFLVQESDVVPIDGTGWEQQTGGEVSAKVHEDLVFAMRVCRHVRSNAVVVAAGGATVGIGGGQTSRVEAVRGALARSGEKAQGAVAASDAFFPFADGLEALAAGGVQAVVAPGGSKRDGEVVEAAKQVGVALFFAPYRHFRH